MTTKNIVTINGWTTKSALANGNEKKCSDYDRNLLMAECQHDLTDVRRTSVRCDRNKTHSPLHWIIGIYMLPFLWWQRFYGEIIFLSPQSNEPAEKMRFTFSPIPLVTWPSTAINQRRAVCGNRLLRVRRQHVILNNYQWYTLYDTGFVIPNRFLFYNR